MSTEYSIEVERYAPYAFENQPHAFFLPTTIPDIIEQIGKMYGGGYYRLFIRNSTTGDIITSKEFEISGLPKGNKPLVFDTSQDDHGCWVCHKDGCRGCPKEAYVLGIKLTIERALVTLGCSNRLSRKSHQIKMDEEFLLVHETTSSKSYCRECAPNYLKSSLKELQNITNATITRFE